MGNISLVRVGGVCAILGVVSAIVARIFFGFGDIVTGHWFDALYGLLLIPATLGFYRALRQAGPLPLIAVVAFLTGVIFLLFHEFIRLGIAYELAPGITDTLSQTGWLAAGVGSALFVFIGIPLFSITILRTSVMPKWIGWLGLIVVVLNVVLNVVVVTILLGVFESINPPWFLARGLLVWLVVMGVVLLRLKEPVAPDSVA